MNRIFGTPKPAEDLAKLLPVDRQARWMDIIAYFKSCITYCFSFKETLTGSSAEIQGRFKSISSSSSVNVQKLVSLLESIEKGFFLRVSTEPTDQRVGRVAKELFQGSSLNSENRQKAEQFIDEYYQLNRPRFLKAAAVLGAAGLLAAYALYAPNQPAESAPISAQSTFIPADYRRVVEDVSSSFDSTTGAIGIVALLALGLGANFFCFRGKSAADRQQGSSAVANASGQEEDPLDSTITTLAQTTRETVRELIKKRRQAVSDRADRGRLKDANRFTPDGQLTMIKTRYVNDNGSMKSAGTTLTSELNGIHKSVLTEKAKSYADHIADKIHGISQCSILQADLSKDGYYFSYGIRFVVDKLVPGDDKLKQMVFAWIEVGDRCDPEFKNLINKVPEECSNNKDQQVLAYAHLIQDLLEMHILEELKVQKEDEKEEILQVAHKISTAEGKPGHIYPETVQLLVEKFVPEKGGLRQQVIDKINEDSPVGEEG